MAWCGAKPNTLLSMSFNQSEPLISAVAGVQERHACYCLYNILRTSQGPDIAHLSFEALLRVLSCDSFESLSEFGVSRTPDVFWLVGLFPSCCSLSRT